MEWIFTFTPLRFFVQSLWRDEAFSYLIAQKNPFEIIFISARDFSPPLYFLLLNFWMRIFGASEIALRSFSLITFAALIYVAYLFLTNIFKIKLKWTYVYLVLFLLNPFLVYYAFEARMYMLLALFAFLSFYFLYQFRPVKYCVIVLCGLLTHYFMFFVLISQVIFAFTARSYKMRDSIFQLKTIIRPVVLYIPWLVFLLFQHKFDGAFWLDKPHLKKLLEFPAIMYLGYETNIKQYQNLLIPVSIFLLSIIVYGFWKITSKKYTVATKEKRDLLYLILSWALVPPIFAILVSFIYPIFFPRYLIFSAVGMIVLMVFLLEQIDRRMRWIFFAALLILSLHFNGVQANLRIKAPLKVIVSEIKAQMNDEDLLYVTSELDFQTSQYYLDMRRVFIYGKTYEQIPQFVGKVLMSPENIATTLPTFPNKAFILKDDLSYDIQSSF